MAKITFCLGIEKFILAGANCASQSLFFDSNCAKRAKIWELNLIKTN